MVLRIQGTGGQPNSSPDERAAVRPDGCAGKATGDEGRISHSNDSGTGSGGGSIV